MLVDLDVVDPPPLGRMNDGDFVVPDVLVEDFAQEVTIQGVGQSLDPVAAQTTVAEDLAHPALRIARSIADQHGSLGSGHPESFEMGQHRSDDGLWQVSALRAATPISGPSIDLLGQTATPGTPSWDGLGEALVVVHPGDADFPARKLGLDYAAPDDAGPLLRRV